MVHYWKNMTISMILSMWKSLLIFLTGSTKSDENLLLAVAGSDTYDDLWRKVHDILADKTVALYSPHVNISKDEIVFYDFSPRAS